MKKLDAKQRQTDEERLNEIEESMYFNMQLMEPTTLIFKSDFDHLISLSRKGLEADRYRKENKELNSEISSYSKVTIRNRNAIIELTAKLKEAEAASKLFKQTVADIYFPDRGLPALEALVKKELESIRGAQE